MAEKYGTIPKKFTKEWWEYFWDYYKIHTIAIAFIFIAVVSTIYSVLTSPKYDLFITYTASEFIDDAQEQKLTEYINERIEDIDANGKTTTNIQQYVFSYNSYDAQYISAMISKLHIDFVNDDTMLFIFSDDKKDYLIGTPELDGAFENVNKWAPDISTDELLYKDGEACAVSLKNSKKLKEMGIECDELYIAVRNFSTNDQTALKRLEASKIIANELLK